jgi:hypothetical protein
MADEKALQPWEMNNEQLGKFLVQNAEKQTRQAHIETLTRTVQAYVAVIREQEQLIEKHSRRKRVYEERLKAIEKGQFSVNENGVIFFDELRLMSSDVNV